MAGFLQTMTGWLVVLVFFFQPTSGSEPCEKRCPIDSDDRFKLLNRSHNTIMTWVSARDLCRSRGMTLPIIRTPCQQYLLTSFLQTEGVFEYDVWLGGKTKENHQWEWLNGSQLTDNDFSNQTTGCKFAYVSMSPNVTLGNDNSSTERNFICEFYDVKTCLDEDANKQGHYMAFNSLGNEAIKCYVPSRHASNWYNARTHCRRRGGDLATSRDVMESFSQSKYTENKMFWVGLRQVKWRWENNDQDVDMTFFRAINVDNADNDSECMFALRGEQWIWDSRPCNNKTHQLLVVCQKEMRPWRQDCSDNSLSWKIGTCTLIVTTILLLAIVSVLIIYLRRLLKVVDSDVRPDFLNDEQNTYTREVSRMRHAVEEHSTLQTTQIVEKTNETTKKRLPTVIPAKPDEAYASTLPEFPFEGPSAIPDPVTPVTPYAVQIHLHEYHKQISTFSSLSYENVTSMHPVQTDLWKKSNKHPVKPKPKPEPKKTDEPCKDTIQPYNNLAPYDVERSVSPSLHSGENEATDNASDRPVNQHSKSKYNKGRVLNEDGGETVRETYTTLDTRSREAVFYENEEHFRRYQKMKYPTDPDGYLQPNNFEQASASSMRKGHSSVTAVYANADGTEPSSSGYANEGSKATAKKGGKLTARLRSKLQKARATNPLSPTVIVSAFRKHSVTRSVSLDRSYSNERASKGSNHIYAEIVPDGDDDDVSKSTNQPTDVQHTSNEHTKTEHTRKERTKLQKKLSAKNWSENEGVVGY